MSDNNVVPYSASPDIVISKGAFEYLTDVNMPDVYIDEEDDVHRTNTLAISGRYGIRNDVLVKKVESIIEQDNAIRSRPDNPLKGIPRLKFLKRRIKNAKGKEIDAYAMDRDGYLFLAAKLNCDEAFIHQQFFIHAFNRLDVEQAQRRYIRDEELKHIEEAYQLSLGERGDFITAQCVAKTRDLIDQGLVTGSDDWMAEVVTVGQLADHIIRLNSDEAD